MEFQRECSPLVLPKKRKKKKSKRHKRKRNDLDDPNKDSIAAEPSNKKRKLNVTDNNATRSKQQSLRLNLTQSVCCPICIVDLSLLSEFAADAHIEKCDRIYQQMKQQQAEARAHPDTNTNAILLHNERRKKQIKHAQIVTEWKNILQTPTAETNRKQHIKANMRHIAAFQKLRGTNIVINKFNYDSIENINNAYSVHFLTHFRCDYYIGLTSQWNKPIYCSKITASFLKQMLNVKDAVVCGLEMNTRTQIPDSNPITFVTLLNANNHIPGSVNLLFEITDQRETFDDAKENKTNENNDTDQKVVTLNGQKHLSMHNWLKPYQGKTTQRTNIPSKHNQEAEMRVIHTDLYCGDCHIDVEDDEPSQLLAKMKIRNLYLDTTFCHPQYKYMAERVLFEKLRVTMDGLVDKCNDDQTKIAFLFGVEFIERMKLFLFLSKHFKQKICVNQTKKKWISWLEFNEEDNNRFTVKQEEASMFQITALKNISFKHLKCRLENEKRWERIVGVKLMNPKGKNVNIRKTSKGNVTMLTVPYSEHCNYEELIHFVKKVKPLKIIPTANLKESTKYIARYF